MNASTGAPFNITTGFDDNRDGSVNDRPAGLRHNANLTPDFYSQDLFIKRMICVPGTSTKFVGGAVKCFNSSGAESDQVTLRKFLTDFYPNGVIAQGPGNFNVTTSLSKTFGFGHRNGNGLQSQTNQNGAGGEGDQNGGQTANGRGGPRRGGPGGRGGGGGGGGVGGRRWRRGGRWWGRWRWWWWWRRWFWWGWSWRRWWIWRTGRTWGTGRFWLGRGKLAFQLNLYPQRDESAQPCQFRSVQRQSQLAVLRIAEQRGGRPPDGFQCEG